MERVSGRNQHCSSHKAKAQSFTIGKTFLIPICKGFQSQFSEEQERWLQRGLDAALLQLWRGWNLVLLRHLSWLTET